MALPVPAREKEKAKPEELGVIQLGELEDTPSIYNSAHDSHAQRPVELAARLLERYRRRDAAFPDLEMIAASKMIEYHCTPDLSNAKGWTPFSVVSQALPADLWLQAAASGARTGLLPGLDRVWVARERSLWFWNADGDPQKFDDFDSDVLSVDVLKPAKDVFVDTVKNVLIVTTKTQMHIYAVSTSSDIFDTSLSIPAEGLGATKCVSTSEGRIFFTAANTGLSLWEARYSNTESWFRARTSKSCQWGHGLRSGFFGSLFGTVEKLEHQPQGESVVDLEIDDSNQLLYMLTSRSTVLMFKFNASTIWHERTYTIETIRSQLLAAVVGDTQLSDVVKTLKLLSITALRQNESAFIRLVALAASGHRIYFRTQPRNSLQAVYIHRIPSEKSAEVSGGRVIGAGSGLAAMSQGKLFVAALDRTRIRHQRDLGGAPSFSELSGWLPGVQGILVDIQPSTIPDEWFVLTTTTLLHLRQRRFDERLETTELPAIQLANTYGHMEICAAALAVAAKPTTQISRQQRDAAVATFFRFGGLPVYKKDIEAMRSSFLDADPKSLIGQSAAAVTAQTSSMVQPKAVSVRMSALFDGLAVYTTRNLADLWDTTILTQTKTKNDVVTQSTVDTSVLERTYLLLTSLVEFLDKNRAFSEGQSNRKPPPQLQALQALTPNDISVLNQAEHRGLQAIGRLVKSAQQGIAFLLLILTETASTPRGIDTLLQYFSSQNRDQFVRMTFSQFWIAGRHSDVARELVTCLVNFVINRGDSIDSVARIIQDRCESYCSAADVLVYKALEYLHTAKAQSAESMQLLNLQRSAELFRKAAAAIQIDTLRDIVSEYDQYKYFVGSVEVALAVAAETDLANVAVGYLREGRPHGDPREVVYKAKHRVYDVIFEEVLSKHSEIVDTTLPIADAPPALRAMLSSNDEVFHYALYDWLLRTDRAEKLAKFATATHFLQPYLQVEAKHDLRAADLLWKLYQRRGDLLAAAYTLLGVAKGDLPVPMSQRVEYLSRAMGYCNCPYPPELRYQVSQLTTMVQAYLQVATIQSDVLLEVQKDESLDPKLKDGAVKVLEAKLLTLSELFNNFAEPQGYYTVCLAILNVADYRDPVEVRETWEKLLTRTRLEDEVAATQHYAHVGALITRLGTRYYGQSDFVFPLDMLLPLLEQYAEENCSDAPAGWLIDAFLNAGAPYGVLYSGLINLLQQQIYPFSEPGPARQVANDILYLVEQWRTHGDQDARLHMSKADLDTISKIVGGSSVAQLITS